LTGAECPPAVETYLAAQLRLAGGQTFTYRDAIKPPEQPRTCERVYAMRHPDHSLFRRGAVVLRRSCSTAQVPASSRQRGFRFTNRSSHKQCWAERRLMNFLARLCFLCLAVVLSSCAGPAIVRTFSGISGPMMIYQACLATLKSKDYAIYFSDDSEGIIQAVSPEVPGPREGFAHWKQRLDLRFEVKPNLKDLTAGKLYVVGTWQQKAPRDAEFRYASLLRPSDPRATELQDAIDSYMKSKGGHLQ
jgi:hypothetical protein